MWPQVAPYVVQQAVNGSEGGETELVGFIIDLLERIADVLNVNFNISLVKDGAFGKRVGDQWTGIIGEVARGVRICSCLVWAPIFNFIRVSFCRSRPTLI